MNKKDKINVLNKYMKTLKGYVGESHPQFNFASSFVRNQRDKGISDYEIFLEVVTYITESDVALHSERTILNNEKISRCIQFMENNNQWVSMEQVIVDIANRSNDSLKNFIAPSHSEKPVESSMLNRMSMIKRLLSLSTPEMEGILNIYDKNKVKK